jgi:membrane fusion protein, multidrug efflux system
MRVLRYILVVLGVVVVIGALAGIKGAQIGSLIAFGEKAAANGPPPEAVSVAEATDATWESTIAAVGSVTSSKGVAVAAEVPGKVVAVRFDSGDTVKAGKVLVELDTTIERAQLRSLMTRKKLAVTTVARSRKLLASGAIPQARLDADESALDTLRADAAGLSAQIAKKIIRAPFSGRLGIRSVNLGQYLNPGEPVTVLESVDGVFVDFTLPQRNETVAVGMPVRITTEGNRAVALTGTISAVDPTVDAVTRSIRVRASVDDGQKTNDLKPGMFVDMAVVLPDKRPVVSVPATAIVHAPYGDSVYVVEDKPTDAPGLRETPDGAPVLVARQQFVRVGASRGDFVAVEDGLNAGQTVVVAGAFKLRNGAPVVVGDPVALAPQLSPKPPNR